MSFTFVSDYKVGGFYSVYICWIAILVCRIFSFIQFSKREFLFQCLLFFIISPFLLSELINSGDSYYNSLIVPILYINAFLMLPFFYRNFKVVFFISFVFLMVSALIVMAGFLSGTGRVTIVFGPNVMYRIYAFLFGFIFLYFYFARKNSFSYIYFLIAFVFFSICMVGTSSRGASLVLMFYLVFMIFRYKAIGLTFNFLVFLLLSFSLFLFYFVYTYWSLVWRLLYFNVDNASEASRIGFLSKFLDFLTESDYKELLFGVGSDNRFFSFYPHNIFVESFVYFGVFYFLLTLLSYLIYFYILFFKKNGLWLLPFCGIYIGAMVSGDFFYNFPVLTFVFYCLYLFLNFLIEKHNESSFCRSLLPR